MIIKGEKIVLRAVKKADNVMILFLINAPDTEMILGGQFLAGLRG